MWLRWLFGHCFKLEARFVCRGLLFHLRSSEPHLGRVFFVLLLVFCAILFQYCVSYVMSAFICSACFAFCYVSECLVSSVVWGRSCLHNGYAAFQSADICTKMKLMHPQSTSMRAVSNRNRSEASPTSPIPLRADTLRHVKQQPSPLSCKHRNSTFMCLRCGQNTSAGLGGSLRTVCNSVNSRQCLSAVCGG